MDQCSKLTEKELEKLTYSDCTKGRGDAPGAYLVSDITPLDVGGWLVINESHFMKKESNIDDFFPFFCSLSVPF